MRTDYTSSYIAELIKTTADGGHAPFITVDCYFATGTVNLTASDIADWGNFRYMEESGPFGPLGVELDGMKVNNLGASRFSNNLITNTAGNTLVIVNAGFVGQADVPEVDRFYIGSYDINDDEGTVTLNLINPLKRYNQPLGYKINRTAFPKASYSAVGDALGYVCGSVSNVPLIGLSVGYQSALVDDIDATTTGNIYLRYSGQVGKVTDLPTSGGIFFGDELVPLSSRTFNNPSSATDVHNNYITIPSAARSILAVAPGSAYGSGYAVGNILTIVGGSGTGGKVKVEAVTSAGAVVAISLNAAGSNYVSSYDLTVTGGGGTGFKLDIAAGGRSGRARPYQQGTVVHECMTGYKYGFPVHASYAAYPPRVSGIPQPSGYAWNLSDTTTLSGKTLTTCMFAKHPRRVRGAGAHSHIDRRSIGRNGSTGTHDINGLTFTSIANQPNASQLGTAQNGYIDVVCHISQFTFGGGTTGCNVGVAFSGSHITSTTIYTDYFTSTSSKFPPPIKIRLPINNVDWSSDVFSLGISPGAVPGCTGVLTIDSVKWNIEYTGGDSVTSEVKDRIEVAGNGGHKDISYGVYASRSVTANIPTLIAVPQEIYLKLRLRVNSWQFVTTTFAWATFQIYGTHLTTTTVITETFNNTVQPGELPELDLLLKMNNPDLSAGCFTVTVGGQCSTSGHTGSFEIDEATWVVEYPRGDAEVLPTLEIISDGPMVTADFKGYAVGGALVTNPADHLSYLAGIVGVTLDSVRLAVFKTSCTSAGYTFNGLIKGYPLFFDVLNKWQEECRFSAWHSRGQLRTRFIPDVHASTTTIDNSVMSKRLRIIEGSDDEVKNLINVHYNRNWLSQDYQSHAGEPTLKDTASVSDHGLKELSMLLDFVTDDAMALSIGAFYLNLKKDKRRKLLMEVTPTGYQFEQQDDLLVTYSSYSQNLVADTAYLEYPPLLRPGSVSRSLDGKGNIQENEVPFVVQLMATEVSKPTSIAGFIAGISKAGDHI